MESTINESVSSNGLYFLRSGGEMGELTRTLDWENTSLGTPHMWPKSLQTTLSIVLNSAFPMFLWWGDDLICFYNDAYRPSLGIDGKHPAVGKKAVDVWPEIWDFISPLIQKVQTTGEAIWFEDQIVPIYRNGSMEDVYWTFSYSPVYNDEGNIGGVLVTCIESTKSVEAREKLRESDKRFQHFVRDATVGIIVLMGENMVVEIVNDAYASLIGRTTEDLLGKELFKLIPETEKHFKEIIEKVRITGNSVYLYDHEYMIYANGVEKRGYLNIVYQPYKEDDGTIAGVMALCHDVTNQVISTRKVKESEKQVRSIIEAAPFPIGIYIGREMRIEYVNQSILDAWKKDRSIIGKTFLEVLPELTDTRFPEQLDMVYTTGEAFHARNQLVNFMEDGKLQPYYFNYSYTPLFDENGKVYGVMNTAAEVTDLAVAKMKMETGAKMLQNIILQAPVAMCIYKGSDYIVDIANNKMLEFWGVNAGQILNKPLFEAMPHVRDQGFEQILNNILETGTPFIANEMTATLIRDGKPQNVYINFSLEPIRELDESISAIFATAIDVTEQVLSRQKIEDVVEERTRELAETNIELQRSNAELGQFAYIASHDLQEPLRKVSTFAQMLEHSLGSIDERSKNYIGKINKATERMTGLVRDVLSYSQLSKENKQYEQVELNKIVADICADYELLIEQKGAKIIFQNLPVIEAIPLQMSQLFSNLISNALKFSRNDTQPIIKIEARLLNKEEAAMLSVSENYTSCYKISVEDNGIGFEQAHSRQIFNIFQRLHGKTEYSGTGIGLAMCKKIAENHRGEIFATSSPGNGASFTIILPEHQ